MWLAIPPQKVGDRTDARENPKTEDARPHASTSILFLLACVHWWILCRRCSHLHTCKQSLKIAEGILFESFLLLRVILTYVCLRCLQEPCVIGPCSQNLLTFIVPKKALESSCRWTRIHRSKSPSLCLMLSANPVASALINGANPSMRE